MSTMVLDEGTALTHAGLTAGDCRRGEPDGHVGDDDRCDRARRRRRSTSAGKHAFAFREFCPGHRRADRVASAQVASGPEPVSLRNIGGSTSFYDPATAQFISRDPANALTRLPYGYTYGNPLNHTDRNGLWPWDGTCVAIGNNGCDNSGTQQLAANFDAGVLNGISLGHGQAILDAAGQGQKADLSSGAAHVGFLVGNLPYIAGLGEGALGAGAAEGSTAAVLGEAGTSFVGDATLITGAYDTYMGCFTPSGSAGACLMGLGTATLGAYASIASEWLAASVGYVTNYMSEGDWSAVGDWLRKELGPIAANAEPLNCGH